MVKPILKLFRPPGSSVILIFFLIPRQYPIPRVTLSAEAINTVHGLENWVSFISETV